MNFLSVCDKIAEHGYGTFILSEEKVYSNLPPQKMYMACLASAKYIVLYEDNEVYFENGVLLVGVPRMEKVLRDIIDIESICPSSPFIACCTDDFGIACFVKTTNREDAVYHLVKGLSLIEKVQGSVDSTPLMN